MYIRNEYDRTYDDMYGNLYDCCKLCHWQTGQIYTQELPLPGGSNIGNLDYCGFVCMATFCSTMVYYVCHIWFGGYRGGSIPDTN